MMAPHPDGRPGSSRRSAVDHRTVARIVLALARQMAAEADEAAQSAVVDEVVSSGAGTCARNERAASVGRCAANEPFLAGRCAHQPHESAHYLAHGTSSAGSHTLPDRVGAAKADEAAAPSSTSGGTL